MENNTNQYALLIGVGKREEDSPAMAITAQDAQAIQDKLRKMGVDNIACLTEQRATQQNILDSLDKLIAKTQEKKASMVWVYFSGHGYQTKGKKEFYLVCADTKSETFETSALVGKALTEKLQAIQTDKMVILLDCCHAGAIIPPMQEPVDLPLEDDFLKTAYNRVVLTSSHRDEVSYLSEPVSLFTYSLIKGLNGDYLPENEMVVSVFDLSMYVREMVVALVKQLQRHFGDNNLKQHPQLNVLPESKTENFPLVVLSKHNRSEPAFKDGFKLYDEQKQPIDLELQPEKDTFYREKFEWLMNNHITIDGDNNIVTNVNGQNITINQNASNEELLEIIKNFQVQINDLIVLLKNQQNNQMQYLGQRLETVSKQMPPPTQTSLDEFRALLFELLDNKGFVATPEVFIEIERCTFQYNKGNLENLKVQATSQLIQLAPAGFLVALKNFILTIQEKK